MAPLAFDVQPLTVQRPELRGVASAFAMTEQQAAAPGTPEIGRPFASDSSQLLGQTVSKPPVRTLVP